MANKKIIVIGNAPYNPRRKLGKIIDDCDVIVRFNFFQLEGYEQYIGSRTTAWCFRNSMWKNIKEQENQCDQMWIMASSYISEGPMSRAAEWGCKLIQLPKEIGKFATQLLGNEFPSVGIIGMLAAIHLYQQPIFVLGFNGFRSKDKIHYFEDKSVGFCRHDGEKEIQALLALKKKGLIIPNKWLI